ncbi:MAG: lasso peptide [Spirirestis rafaelensis WJT71-NPBG6]|jgi:hypothetical protein|nr:lasso peptide [Spirirestis rafaelensis WJT71-NPBG6]
MKKQYSTPNLTTHGSVEAITEFTGQTDRNDFLFFNAGSSPITAGGSPITGNGSVDGVLTPPSTEVTPRGTLQGQ